MLIYETTWLAVVDMDRKQVLNKFVFPVHVKVLHTVSDYFTPESKKLHLPLSSQIEVITGYL